MLCRALLGTLGRHGAVATAGSILCAGLNLVGAPEATWRRIRGREIGYVPQSSLAGLNPVLTIGTQLMESISCVRRMTGRELQREALELLDMVRIPRAKELLKERPHQLSGGMRQRVMIATALAQRPKLLVADEPTTALDVTTQREILTLLVKLRKELGMSLILVSHDLAVIEEVCDSMVVMYAGLAVEAGPRRAVDAHPAPSVYPRPARFAGGYGRPRQASGDDHRRAGGCRRLAGRLSLRPAVCPCAGLLQGGPPAAAQAGGSATVCLHLRRTHGGAVMAEALLEAKDVTVTFGNRLAAFDAVQAATVGVAAGDAHRHRG